MLSIVKVILSCIPNTLNCALKSDNYFRDVYEYGNVEAVRKMKDDI